MFLEKPFFPFKSVFGNTTIIYYFSKIILPIFFSIMISKKQMTRQIEDSDLVDYTEESTEPSSAEPTIKTSTTIKILLGASTWKQLDPHTKGKLIDLQRSLEEKIKKQQEEEKKRKGKR